MGRKFPIGENSTTHSIISISLLIACMAATIVVVSSLCGLTRRKQSPSEKKIDEGVNSQEIEAGSEENDKPMVTATPTLEKTKSNNDIDTSNSSEFQRLNSPPKLKHARASSYHFQRIPSVSVEKLTSSMSMKLQGWRQASKREVDMYKKIKDRHHKQEDSLWNKKIILGDKCKVPDEDEEDIIYDKKGNRISTYHPKQPATLPSLTRQSSV